MVRGWDGPQASFRTQCPTGDQGWRSPFPGQGTNSFPGSPRLISRSGVISPLFTDEGTGAQRRRRTCLSHTEGQGPARTRLLGLQTCLLPKRRLSSAREEGPTLHSVTKARLQKAECAALGVTC